MLRILLSAMFSITLAELITKTEQTFIYIKFYLPINATTTQY